MKKIAAARPNPFNPSTTIEYAVPVGISNLNLSLYDMHGRLVCGAAVGVEDSTIDRVGALLDANIDIILDEMIKSQMIK